MCSLYSMTSNQRSLVGVMRVKEARTGNLPSLPATDPDSVAPVWFAMSEERSSFAFAGIWPKCRG